MKKIQLKKPDRKGALKCLALILLLVLVAFIGVVSATTYTNSTKNCSNLNVRFVAGSDSLCHPVSFPAATVKVAPSYTSAFIAFSLFPSASNPLQPTSCYTNLLQIKNLGKTCNVNNITITNIVGAANLGNLTIYYYATQTNSPQTGTPIASASLTNSSSGTIHLLSSPYTLAASTAIYVEIVGYAAETAMSGSTISFTTNMQVAPAQPLTYTVKCEGSLLMKHSAGTYSGIYGSQAFFEFNIKRVDTQISGKLSLILCHRDTKGYIHVYQITSNDPSSLNVNKTASPTSSTANFNMTATIRDITSLRCPITITNNANLQATLTDYSNKPDTIAFTATSPSGQLYFSSNWVCGHSIEQDLWRGTLSIR